MNVDLCQTLILYDFILTGSRSGALIASTWAAMMYFGEDGYVESTRKIVETTRYIASEYVLAVYMFYIFLFLMFKITK